ncbi:hypothetical protein EPD60_07100 [Flaviaesturariibacter flavus]|uniref:ATPase AAA-type core domain-containing protein n=1 Tax=Flaviaesturariibacter flavus TaxID=2502780 RepID=A0A4R1BII4_9BACT|nr:AAA family ATPase [Flaviaesturariibacter flavus]TCJ17071.1 hypothetical protein EPD60_07100 [Flaviaesturariibacter flavus]
MNVGHYLHFTTEFIEKIKNDPKKGLVFNKLEEIRAIDKPEGLNSIDSYSKGILVLKFVKGNTCRTIIEPQWVDINGSKVSVYFVRDFVSKKSFDYFWGTIIHPQLTSGEWLSKNPLPSFEVETFKAKFQSRLEETHNLPSLPPDITSWIQDFKIKIDFDVYEREAWVNYTSDRTSENGLQEKYILFFRDTIKAVLNNESELSKVKIECIDDDNKVFTAIHEPFEIGIIYSDFSDVAGKRVVVIHDGAIIKDQPQRWQNAIENIAKRKHPIRPDLLEISKDAFRAYPKWIITNDNEDLWIAIQRYEGSHNLSLLPEQVEFLNNFKFPAYINGQAGSGKSTMLYYLFANVFFYKVLGQFTGNIIFLTENENLLDKTAQAIIGLLSSNPEYSVGFTLEERDNARAYFTSFKNYLLDILPEEERENFTENKYLDFARFKDIFNESPSISKRYSAEEVWFVFSTYVYGYYEIEIVDTIDKYTDDKNGIPSKFRIVDNDSFSDILKLYHSFFRKLHEDGFWDKTRIVRKIRTYYPSKLPKQYVVVFCDEAQDFTRIELRLILQSSLFTSYDLSETDQIPVVFAGDALQTVSPTGFSDTRLHQMYFDAFSEAKFKYDKTRSTYNPEFNYRSSQPIVRLANVIQNFRMKALGEENAIAQKSKRVNLSATIPILHSKEWVEQEPNTEIFIKKFKFKTFIVPVDLNEENEYRQSQRLLSNGEITDVKSSIDAKGAEYSQVVVFGFGEYFLKEFQTLTWTAEYVDFKKRFFFNKLYVAITRAQNELVIIDSRESIDKFWKPLLSPPNNFEAWEIYEEINEILPIEPHTGLESILESTPDDALLNAKQDMEQGISDSNIGRLVVASNVFLMLGKVNEANNCLGYKEKIRKQWIRAGSHFEKAQNYEEASDCYFRGKSWENFKRTTRVRQGNKQEVRAIITKLMEDIPWTKDDVSKIYELRNIISDTISTIDWYNEFSNKLTVWISGVKNIEEKRSVAFVLESFVNENDIQLWKLVGQLYFESKLYNNSIEAWEKIVNVSEKPNYFPDYVKAHLLKADDENNEIDKILWSGRLLSLKISEGESVSASKQILSGFEQSRDTLFSHPIKTELIQHVFHAATILSNYDLISEIGPRLENEFKDAQRLAEILSTMIFTCRDEFVCGFLKERWAKAKYRQMINEAIDKGLALERINIEFDSFQFPFPQSNGHWTIDELNEIPDRIEVLTSSPPHHFKSITIKNFRRFGELKIANIGQFNIIVGNNNSGKTSLLEGLLFSHEPDVFLENALYTFKQRNNTSTYDLKDTRTLLNAIINQISKSETLEFTIADGRRFWSYEVRNPSNLELSEIKDIKDSDPRLFIGIKEKRSRIKISSRIDHISFDLNQASSIRKIPFIPFGKGYLDKLSEVYFDEVGSKRSVREHFVRHMSTFIPRIVDISIEPNSKTILIGESDGNVETSMPLYDYGEGANKLFRILVQLYAARDNKLMIDEIDAGIHYSKFEEYSRIILDVALELNVQIFATTHSEEWLKEFSESVRKHNNLKIKDRTRIITLERHVKNKNIVPVVREFSGFEYAMDNNFELRGHKL